MPGSGTDSTREWIGGGPVVVLVEPQLGENIGTTARAMANFGLGELRLVNPRDGWPSERAYVAASGASRLLDHAKLFPDLRAAVADLQFVFAATARDRGMNKPVRGADAAATELFARAGRGERVGVLFGRERTGLYSDEVSFADEILTFPVNPAFASLNLAQAVLIVGYEWFKLRSRSALPFAPPAKSRPATREQLLSFFDHVEGALERAGFFRPVEKKPVMVRNLRNIFHRLGLTEQDVRTLRGAIVALEFGRGAARDALKAALKRRDSPAGNPDGLD